VVAKVSHNRAKNLRIIVYDQRGAGRSTPLGEISANTTPHLIADLERLRVHLAIEQWLVFGGSWGSTLALAYAEAHPGHVLGLVLRGIFLCRPQEIRWFLYDMRFVFPEAWRAFAGFLPEVERGDLLGNYHRRLIDADPAEQLKGKFSGRGYSAFVFQGRDSAGQAWYVVRIGHFKELGPATRAAVTFTMREKMPAYVRPLNEL